MGLLSLELILYRNNIELLSWSVALINQKFYVKNNHIRENSSKYQRIIFQIWFSSSFFFYQELVKPLFFFFQLLGHVWFLLNFIELNYFGTNTTNFMFGAKKFNWMSKYGLTTKSSIVTKTYLRETFGIIFFSKLVCYPKPLNLNWILIYYNYFYLCIIWVMQLVFLTLNYNFVLNLYIYNYIIAK